MLRQKIVRPGVPDQHALFQDPLFPVIDCRAERWGEAALPDERSGSSRDPSLNIAINWHYQAQAKVGVDHALDLRDAIEDRIRSMSPEPRLALKIPALFALAPLTGCK